MMFHISPLPLSPIKATHSINRNYGTQPMTDKLYKKNITREKFLPSEDLLIVDLVKKYGTDWEVIEQHFGLSRNKRQIRERWQNYLNPEINPNFSQLEDDKLLSLVEKYGQRWAKIANIIGNKSAIHCRNRHRVLLKMIENQKKREAFEREASKTDVMNCTNDLLNIAETHSVDDHYDSNFNESDISEPPTPNKAKDNSTAFDDFDINCIDTDHISNYFEGYFDDDSMFD
ncbi:Myb-like DNA-binding domain containing protein [Tritrichomonas foetus]|uniref:Myb-like DNA-binding domain containing protein n=1 Tax=Tritrichomonas foetus TaxID=1144522 RepID=A0A1J4KZS9_9EUKA|nr:Myb-like DNA-binding domain containing protein [Tritrichomonas foetus]|eukprot:OHT15101.1 Myb-like DNA-binding domain containing protein [Tritrichomonas foetus]